VAKEVMGMSGFEGEKRDMTVNVEDRTKD